MATVTGEAEPCTTPALPIEAKAAAPLAGLGVGLDLATPLTTFTLWATGAGSALLLASARLAALTAAIMVMWP